VINLHRPACKVLFNLSNSNQNWVFSTDFWKIPQPSDFTKNPSCGSHVVPCGQEDRRTDGRTDRYDATEIFTPTELFRRFMCSWCKRDGMHCCITSWVRQNHLIRIFRHTHFNTPKSCFTHFTWPQYQIIFYFTAVISNVSSLTAKEKSPD